jgi:hypothetical protein
LRLADNLTRNGPGPVADHPIGVVFVVAGGGNVEHATAKVIERGSVARWI